MRRVMSEIGKQLGYALTGVDGRLSVLEIANVIVCVYLVWGLLIHPVKEGKFDPSISSMNTMCLAYIAGRGSVDLITKATTKNKNNNLGHE